MAGPLERRPDLWRAVGAIGWSIALVLALVLPLGSLQAATAPSGLPTHFAFGVSAAPGTTWTPQSGIPWDHRMQSLAGGVNTGQGWET